MRLRDLYSRMTLANSHRSPSSVRPQMVSRSHALRAAAGASHRLPAIEAHPGLSFVSARAAIGSDQIALARPTYQELELPANLQAQQWKAPVEGQARPVIPSPGPMHVMEDYIELISIRSDRTYFYQAMNTFIAFECGSLAKRRISKDQDETVNLQTRDAYGFGIIIQFPWYCFGRIVFSIFATKRSQLCHSYSLQYNLELPRVVPVSASIMKMARSGDIVGMEALFGAGEASPADVTPYGTSLLHVGHSIRHIPSSTSDSRFVDCRSDEQLRSY